MRKIVVLLVLLGVAGWWVTQPPKVTTRGLAAPVVKPIATADAAPGHAMTPAPNLLDQTPTPKPAPARKSPLGSALNLRSSQNESTKKQNKQMQSLP